MGAETEAEVQDQCEGSLQPPIVETGRYALCPKCGVRGDAVNDQHGNRIMMPHERGQK